MLLGLTSFPRSGVATRPTMLQRCRAGRWSVPICVPTPERGNDKSVKFIEKFK